MWTKVSAMGSVPAIADERACWPAPRPSRTHRRIQLLLPAIVASTLLIGVGDRAAAEGPTTVAAVPPPTVAEPRFDPATSVPLDDNTTATRRLYANADGSRSLVLSTGAVRARNAAGAWQDLDLRAVPSGAGWVATFAPGAASVGTAGSTTATTSSGPVAFTHAGAVPIPGTAAGSTVTFAGSLAGRTIRMSLQPSGFEEAVVVPTALAGFSYQDVVTMPVGMSVAAAGDGVDFVAAGRAVAHFGGGKATDAMGESAPVAVSIVGQTPGHATFLVSPPSAWMSSFQRAYPVTVDPTFTASSDATGTGNDAGSYDAWVLSAIPELVRWNTQSLEAGNDAANGVTRSLLRFDVSAIPATVAVHSAAVEMKTLLPACPDATCPLSTYQYDVLGLGAPFGANTTWNNQPVTDGQGVAYTEQHVPGSTITPVFNVGTLVRDWVSGARANHGFEIRGHDEVRPNSKWEWLSGENAGFSLAQGRVAAFAPTLTVIYDPAHVPPAAEPVWPTNGLSVHRTQPSFSSTSVADPLGHTVQYYFRIVDSPDFGHYVNTVLDSGWRDAPTWTPPPGSFSAGTTYYWYVYVGDSAGAVASPDPAGQYSFTYNPIMQVLSAPIEPHVYAGASSVLVDWDPPAAGSDKLASYQVSLRDGAGAVVASTTVCGNCTSASFTPLSAVTQYQATVTGIGTDGDAATSVSALAAVGTLPLPSCAKTAAPPTPAEEGPALGDSDPNAPEPVFEPGDDLLRRLDLEAALPLVERLLPGRVGGAWITPTTPAMLCVGVTNAQPGDLPGIQGMIRGPQLRIQIVGVANTTASLDAAKVVADARLDAQANPLWTTADVFTYEPSNSVVVRLDAPDPQAIALVSSGFAAGVFSFEVDALTRAFDVSGTNPNPSRGDYNKYEAGDNVVFQPDGNDLFAPCSSAFAMRDAASGSVVGLTAGHCVNDNTSLRNDVVAASGASSGSPTKIGEVLRDVFRHGGQTDAATFSIDDQTKVTNLVWLTSTDARAVTGDLSERATRVPGLRLCFSSARDHYNDDTCGRLKEHDKTYHEKGRPTRNQLYCIDHVKVRPGSSGAPVFTISGGTVKAGGLVSKGYGSSTGNGNGTTYSGLCFVTIHDIKTVYGLTTFVG